MLFLLVLFPNVIFGQSQESIYAFIKSRPDGMGRPVKMPERSYNSNYDLDGSVNYKIKQRIFIISSDSIYHLVYRDYRYTRDSLNQFIFPDNDSSWYKQMFRYLSDSLPVIDFSKYELVLYSACGQCLAFCLHHGKDHESCHRNACHFLDAWYIRDKEIALITKN